MRNARLITLVLACMMVVGVLPAHGQDRPNPAVTDQGRNVYLVNGTSGRIPNLLDNEEVRKISALQRPQISVAFLSPISPDDQAILLTDGQVLAVLELESGAVRVIDPSNDIDNFLVTGAEFIWLNERIAAIVGLEIIDARTQRARAAYLLLDRLTGELQVAPVGNTVGGQVPIAASPRGNKVLMAALAPNNPAGAGTATFTIPLAQSPVEQVPPRRPAWLQAQSERLLAEMPDLRASVELAALFDPSPPVLQGTARALQLFSYDVESESTRWLLDLPRGSYVSGVAWSPDGAHLALTRSDLSVLISNARSNLDGALLSDLVYRDVTGNLPPASNPFFQNNVLDVFEVNKGEVKQWLAPQGDGTVAHDVSWSSDGQTLLVRHLHPSRVKARRYPVYFLQFYERGSYRFYDPSLRETGRLERAELSAGSFFGPNYGRFVSPDEVIFSANYGTDVHPYYYNRRSGEFRNIADRAGTYAFITPTSSGSRRLLTFLTSFTAPGELYRVNWDGSSPTQLTRLNEPLRAVTNTKQYPVSFKLRNGQTRTGVLILPADAPFPPQNMPIVVWQEGGPTAGVFNQWLAVVESPFGLLPNFGYGLLVVPLYGRYGLGAERFNGLADNANFGQIDIDEQAEIVRQMIAAGWTGPTRVGIVGCSYGGYFVTQSLARHPDLYAAGHSMCALVDTIVEWSRGFPVLMPWLQGLPPYANLDEYRRDSPVYNAGQIKTPLLSFHGTDDFLPITLVENLHLQLVNQGVQAKLLKFVDAGHGFGSNPNAPTPRRLIPIYELYGAQEQLIWFRAYLK